MHGEGFKNDRQNIQNDQQKSLQEVKPFKSWEIRKKEIMQNLKYQYPEKQDEEVQNG